MTGETQDEWIAAVDLSSSFHVLSYSVAVTPVGGIGKQEVERGRENASRTLEEQSTAETMFLAPFVCSFVLCLFASRIMGKDYTHFTVFLKQM